MSNNRHSQCVSVCCATAFNPNGQETDMLTDKNGMTLYVFDDDKAGVSTCYDDCAERWPAYAGKEGDTLPERWTLTRRNDGTMQFAFDGKPTYLFQGDKSKGDMHGDGLGGVWHIIKGQALRPMNGLAEWHHGTLSERMRHFLELPASFSFNPDILKSAAIENVENANIVRNKR